MRGTKWRWQWYGLGRDGVIEEACDSWGTCSQNGHTFKGIFFHHLSLFCARLPTTGMEENGFQTFAADDSLSAWHKQNCKDYGPWLRHNAHAAYVTRDDDGKYGTWWGVPAKTTPGDDFEGIDEKVVELPPSEGTDYRNTEVPLDSIWRLPDDQRWQHSKNIEGEDLTTSTKNNSDDRESSDFTSHDANDRGRGRTVETQSGGLAVLRALYNIVDSKRPYDDWGKYICWWTEPLLSKV